LSLDLVREPRSLVRYGDGHVVRDPTQPNHNGSSFRTIFASIIDQVIKSLSEQGRVNLDQERVAAEFVEAKIACARMSGPSLEMGRDPSGQVDDHQFGAAGFRLGSRQEEQALDDLLEVDRLAADDGEDAAILLGRPIAAKHNVDLAEQTSQRGPQLV